MDVGRGFRAAFGRLVRGAGLVAIAIGMDLEEEDVGRRSIA